MDHSKTQGVSGPGDYIFTLKNGEYGVIAPLAQGGCGIVYIVRHIPLKKEMALKSILTQGAPDPEMMLRFEREARIASRIDHPHALPVTDFFMGQFAEGLGTTTRPCMVMPLVKGPSLEKVIEQDGPLSIANARIVVDQIGGALEAAHSKNIVHRDLKPHQILVERNTSKTILRAYLTDFGMGKMKGEYSQSLTQSGQILGTPMYMAPEQAVDTRNAGVSSDVYGLAAAFFHVIAGRPHIDISDCSSHLAVLLRVQDYGAGNRGVALERLTKYRPDLSPDVEERLAKALHPDPNKRTPTVSILRQGLLDALDECQAEQSRKGRGPSGRRSQHLAAYRQPQGSATLITRRAALTAGGALLLGGFGYLLLGANNQPQQTTPPPPQPPTNPPRIDTARNPPSNPTTQTPTQQPRVEVVESGVKFTIQGNYEQASVHRVVERDGRFTPEHQGTQLSNTRDPTHVEQKLAPGRYQARIIYGDDKTIVVPLQVAQGRTLERMITVPEFNPNDVRVGGHTITREPWVYVSVAEGNQDKSFWYLPQWTLADQAIFLQRQYLANIPAGQQPNRAAGWEILRRMPCRQDPQRPRTLYAVTRQEGKYVIVPDQREVPALGVQDMANSPITGLTLGISQDAINGREFRNANLVGLLQGQIPPGYGVDLPSADELAISMTGGPQNAPFLRFGDNDLALPQEWSTYHQSISSRGIEAIRPLGRSRLSPVGVPILDGGATRFYTNESRVVSGTQFAKVGAMGAEGFVIQDVNADERDPTIGVAYVLRKSN